MQPPPNNPLLEGNDPYFCSGQCKARVAEPVQRICEKECGMCLNCIPNIFGTMQCPTCNSNIIAPYNIQ